MFKNGLVRLDFQNKHTFKNNPKNLTEVSDVQKMSKNKRKKKKSKDQSLKDFYSSHSNKNR